VIKLSLILGPLIASKPHSDLVARVIDGIGEEGLWPALAGLVEHWVQRQPPAIFLIVGTQCPRVIFHPYSPAEAQVQIVKYLADTYRLDPFYNACRDNVSSGLYCLADLAPDHFQQSRYFKEYYRDAGLLDEVNFLARAPQGDAYVMVSLVRYQHERPYRKSELTALRQVNSLVQAILRKAWAQIPLAEAAQTRADGPVMANFDHPLLTSRETEIATLILRGYSSKAAGAALNISPETVRNHRKKLYAKLGVGSQSQLFSLYISRARPG